MKSAVLLIIMITLSNCKNPDIKPDNVNTISQTPIKEDPDIISGNEKDIIFISTDTADTLEYTKGELRKILKVFLELTDDVPLPPDEAYAGANKITVDLGNNNQFSINCELCKDDYYRLYAFFLKIHDCDEQYKVQRETLVTLYRDINFIYGKLQHGGTYYGHQYRRILGYAEYCIYQLNSDKDYGYFNKSYDIRKQKALYLALLKQLIEDETNNDPDIVSKDKPIRKKELFKTVSEIDSLITDYFYLKMARQFQNSNY